MSVHFHAETKTRNDRPAGETDRAVIAQYVAGDDVRQAGQKTVHLGLRGLEELQREKAVARQAETAERLHRMAQVAFDAIGERVPCRDDRFMALAAGSPDAIDQLEGWLKWASCQPKSYMQAYERITGRPLQMIPRAVRENARQLGY